MTYTEHSHVYGAVTEEGLNKFLGRLQRQRPSYFHYATQRFVDDPSLLCTDIDFDPAVTAGREPDPVVTVTDPLPIFHTDPPLAIDWCLQMTDVSIHLYPGGNLPPQLDPLRDQGFALYLRAHLGINCQRDLTGQLAEQENRAIPDEPPLADVELPGPVFDWGDVSSSRAARTTTDTMPTVQTLNVGNILCTSFDVYATGHFEWDDAGFGSDQFLKMRLDGLEIVDIVNTASEGQLEDILECYLAMMLRLGILPHVMQPMEKFVLDVTAGLLEWKITLAEQITLQPTPTSSDVRNNPDVGDDEIRGFVDLVIER